MDQFTKDYDLFLFDFDGTLADTEALHHRAYVRMCGNRGFVLDWDFEKYPSLPSSLRLFLSFPILSLFPHRSLSRRRRRRQHRPPP